MSTVTGNVKARSEDMQSEAKAWADGAKVNANAMHVTLMSATIKEMLGRIQQMDMDSLQTQKALAELSVAAATLAVAAKVIGGLTPVE